ncbi:hypothetical protein [Neoroseomonas rubea]|uniref:hypothetical protein n=1 Tax=Neoroseomonas rubea TaxID=2748666 RepID=UPI0018DFF27D|nr:hypothetical protein [Roseomonas rubea]
MRRLILAAALALALPAGASAQQAGTYAVAGQTPDGQRYEGTATLRQTGTNTWTITWNVAGDTSRGVGLLIPEGPLMVIGYVAGREIGAAAYAVEADGSLAGTWTQGEGGGVGTEILRPQGGGGGAVRK